LHNPPFRLVISPTSQAPIAKLSAPLLLWFRMATAAFVACIELHKLMEAFAKTVSELNRMQSAQTAALLRGEDFTFEEQIAEATRQRDNLKYAILKHQEEHGC